MKIVYKMNQRKVRVWVGACVGAIVCSYGACLVGACVRMVRVTCRSTISEVIGSTDIGL